MNEEGKLSHEFYDEVRKGIPDQKPPPRNDMSAITTEEFSNQILCSHINGDAYVWNHNCQVIQSAIDQSTAAMREELERVKVEIDNAHDYLDQRAAEPEQAKGNLCKRMVGHLCKLDDQLADQSAKMAELERELRHISEVLCGVKVEGDVTLDMVSCFVEGQIDKQSDRADKAEAKLAALESQAVAMREALKKAQHQKINQWYQALANELEKMHMAWQQDDSKTLAMIKSALSNQAGADQSARVQALEAIRDSADSVVAARAKIELPPDSPLNAAVFCLHAALSQAEREEKT